MLRIENISKRFKNIEVFNNITFSINKGEVVSIIGKSGCGKSTLLRCINRLENIDSGTIYLNNIDISKMNLVDLRKNIGIVFQEFNLFEHLTVLENLTIGMMKIHKLTENYSKNEAIKILKKIDLEDKINCYPDELSGGQKQRVAIARTLLMKPKIILLDEPTSALDKEMKREVINLIKQLVNDDMTILIVSHEEDFVREISDKIIKIQDGSIEVKDKNDK